MREQSVYFLVVGKNGPAFRETPAEETRPGMHGVDGRKQTLDLSFASMDMLAKELNSYFSVDRPVLNKTGLTGHYNIKLAATPEFRLRDGGELGEHRAEVRGHDVAFRHPGGSADPPVQDHEEDRRPSRGEVGVLAQLHGVDATCDRFRHVNHERVLAAHAHDPVFVLHDGPPYANGHIHYGHILNKLLKDIVVKSRTMMGHKVTYIPGWDCHGLPIELAVDRELGPKKATMSTGDVRRECEAYARRFVAIQRTEFGSVNLLHTS